jgi:Protein of unknown function (DUF2785)
MWQGPKEIPMANTGWKKLAMFVFCLMVAFDVPSARAQGANDLKAGHGPEFWRKIAKNRYAIPPGEQVFALALELSGYLSSTDPELRDDLAYSILATWIVERRMLSSQELVRLLQDWEANLQSGIGDVGTDSVFKRSFSSLCLATLAQRDLRDPFLGPDRFRRLLDAGLSYMNTERDLRGFDATKGWIHATAHTADLLAALAKNSFFTKEDQGRVLEAIGHRLESADQIFTYGEQDRLANVAATIATRKDFDGQGWNSWFAKMNREDQKVWSESPPKLQQLARFENDSYFLSATAARIPASPASEGARETVLAVLRLR